MPEHLTPIQVRYFDTDAAGHVANIAYGMYAEQGRIAFLQALGASPNVILARLAIDFRSRTRFGDAVEVATGVTKIGRTSFELQQEVRAAGKVAAQIQSVIVCYDYALGASTPIPDALRAELEASI